MVPRRRWERNGIRGHGRKRCKTLKRYGRPGWLPVAPSRFTCQPENFFLQIWVHVKIAPLHGFKHGLYFAQNPLLLCANQQASRADHPEPQRLCPTACFSIIQDEQAILLAGQSDGFRFPFIHDSGQHPDQRGVPGCDHSQPIGSFAEFFPNSRRNHNGFEKFAKDIQSTDTVQYDETCAIRHGRLFHSGPPPSTPPESRRPPERRSAPATP